MGGMGAGVCLEAGQVWREGEGEGQEARRRGQVKVSVIEAFQVSPGRGHFREGSVTCEGMFVQRLGGSRGEERRGGSVEEGGGVT